MAIIIDPVATHGAVRPDALAVVDLETDRRWSYRELDQAADRVAGWLAGMAEPGSGARVAAVARNCPELLLLQFGCVRAGLIFVPINWRLTVAEISDLIADAEPSVLLHDADLAVPTVDLPTFDIAGLCAVCADATGIGRGAIRGFDEASTLLYTSGTSGRPKGVMVSAANAFWGSLNFMIGHAIDARSTMLCDMPLFHTAGLFAAARAPLLAGGTVLISRTFDAEKTLRRIEASGVTHYFAVPQMAQMLWNAPGFDPAVLRNLTVFATGGAPNPPAQIERFVSAGIPMSNGYGMSETCSNFGMPFDDPALLIAKAGSCGVPFLSVQYRIVDEDGNDAAPGTVAELWIGGPSVTSGYWNRPQLNVEAFSGTWFRTGDAAYRDSDGFLYLVDRRKDMYISGGENVFPAEIEAAIAELDGIAEVAVIGIPDERWGEVGQAFLVARAGHLIDRDAVIAHCATRLARFKIPQRIDVCDSLPRTSSGKVQKHLLKPAATLDSVAGDRT